MCDDCGTQNILSVYNKPTHTITVNDLYLASPRGTNTMNEDQDSLLDGKFRDCECADTAYVGARRPCTALLGHRVRKWNARNVIARTVTS